MKFHLLTVGRSQTAYKSLIDDYKKRINKYVPFEELTVQYKSGKNQSSTEVKKREGEKILEKIPKTDVIFLLDEKGKQLSSKGLAVRDRWCLWIFRCRLSFRRSFDQFI
jgi:23S rRNA (pseudouridine1915-N3)-methyltransferase